MGQSLALEARGDGGVGGAPGAEGEAGSILRPGSFLRVEGVVEGCLGFLKPQRLGPKSWLLTSCEHRHATYKAI